MQVDCSPYHGRSRWVIVRDIAGWLLLFATVLVAAAAFGVLVYILLAGRPARAEAPAIPQNIPPASTIAPPDAATRAFLRSFIPPACCVTNDCCFAVPATAVAPLSRDRYRILATGQAVLRTGWSPDGRTWRCACDYDGTKWIVHERAHTRCVFPALQGM